LVDGAEENRPRENELPPDLSNCLPPAARMSIPLRGKEAELPPLLPLGGS